MKPGGFQVAHEKSFSLHGMSVTPQLVSTLNQALSGINFTNQSNRVQFSSGNAGHYRAIMNHDCQKYHEEDIICAILDTMEILGWAFRFQWDSESSSQRVAGASITSRELFMFHRGQQQGYA